MKSKIKDLECVLSGEVLHRLSSIRKCNVLKIVLNVFKAGVIAQEELCSTLQVKVKKVEQTFYDIKDLSLVDNYLDEKRRVYYTVSKDVCLEAFACEDCKYAKQKKIKTKGKTTSITNCTLKKPCVSDNWRYLLGLIKVMPIAGLTKSEFTGDTLHDGRQREGRETTKELVDEWNTIDFTDYVYNEFKKRFGHIIKLKKNIIRKYIVQLKQIFEVEFQGEWRYVLKCYFRSQFKEAEGAGRAISLKMMCERNVIQTFLDANKMWHHLLCEKYYLHCPYWEKGKCQYGKCNKSLRKKLRKSYN